MNEGMPCRQPCHPGPLLLIAGIPVENERNRAHARLRFWWPWIQPIAPVDDAGSVADYLIHATIGALGSSDGGSSDGWRGEAVTSISLPTRLTSEAPLCHGYTLAVIHELTLVAVRCDLFHRSRNYADRTDIAWSAIVQNLYASQQPPSRGDLIKTGREGTLGRPAGTGCHAGDIRYPLDIARSEALLRVIDFSQPVAVLFVAVLHFLTNGDDPYKSVCVFRDCMPAGSYFVVSHITSDETSPTVMATVKDAYSNASAPAVFRSRDEIRQFFAGFELIKPGLVEVGPWRGNGGRPASPPVLRVLGGVGRKR